MTRIIPPTETARQFRHALLDAGFEHAPQIEPDKMHRFPGIGKKPSNRAGWCKLFPDCAGGIYGDWSTGLTATWQADNAASPADQARFQHQIKQARRQREIEQQQQWREAATSARLKWQSAQPETGTHGYLVGKNIQPHGIRSDGYQLLIPLHDISGSWQSLQYIDHAGRKLFLKGGKITGGLYLIGEINPDGKILVCEGFATGATLYENTNTTTAIAFNANNLEPVAVSIHKKYPKAELIICGDNDRNTEGNPGVKAATAAALSVNGKISIPEFSESQKGSDWNDWYMNQRGGVA